jgi:glycosyltransferase involved in cell wall biosynthesis
VTAEVAPRISVVIPTYQRRELVHAAITSLEHQRYDASWEVVVVVDGSTDGTAESLHARDTPLSLRVVEQANQGLSAARNAGAAMARGEYVLFLDDDMEADPCMLAEHDSAHRAGADVVCGAIPMHPDTPATVTAELTRLFVEGSAARFGGRVTEIAWNELVGGQMSLRRDVLTQLGGFDSDCFGVEDWELGHRLARDGYRLVHNPKAVSYQRYVVDVVELRAKHHRHGMAEVAMVAKHPELSRDAFVGQWAHQGRGGSVVRTVALAAPRAAAIIERALMAALELRVARAAPPVLVRRLTTMTCMVAYWRGVRAAGVDTAAMRRLLQ